VPQPPIAPSPPTNRRSANPLDTHSGLLVVAEAICLKSWPYGEADRVLALHSPTHGNIRVMAKGVKRPKSKLASACQALNCCQVQWLPNQLGLGKLLQADPLLSFSGLRNHLLSTGLGLLCAELTLYLSSEETLHDAPPLYHLLKNTLIALNHLGDGQASGLSATGDREALLAALGFITNWLGLSGYLPHWDTCMVCDTVLDEDGDDWHRPILYFSVDLGGLVCYQCRHQSSTRLAMLAANPIPVSQSTMRLLRDPSNPDALTVKPQKILGFLQYYISHKLGRSVKAFDFAIAVAC
jgi:DNA repair protein RecO (recombination protein O)